MLTIDIPHKNYRKLSVLLPSLPAIPVYDKSTVPGLMELHLDRLDNNGGIYTVALSHYYRHPSGDMIPDPDMTMRVDTSTRSIEALTYQDIYRYDQVCIDGEADQSIRKSLNHFLSQWLQNCIDQGH